MCPFFYFSRPMRIDQHRRRTAACIDQIDELGGIHLVVVQRVRKGLKQYINIVRCLRENGFKAFNRHFFSEESSGLFHIYFSPAPPRQWNPYS